MAKVNLRVATLKHGNMKNCDLRGAVLAGADLEVINTCLSVEPNIQIEIKYINPYFTSIPKYFQFFF